MGWLGMLSFALVAAGFAAYIGYDVMNQEIPEGFSDPTKLKKISAWFAWERSVGEFLNIIGVANRAEYMKFTRNGGQFDAVSDAETEVHDEVFDGVSVRIYRPKTSKTKGPALVYFHGGGWIVGSIALYDSLMKYWAPKIEMVIISVEYRLAPKYPFPIPFEDCVTATKYFMMNAEKYDIDASRIAVAGDSSGGNLAAAVTLKLGMDTSLPKLKAQLLLYPALQAMDFLTPSYQQFRHNALINTRQMAEFWLFYAFGNVHHIEQLLVNNHTSPSAKKVYGVEFLSHRHIDPEMLFSGYQPNQYDFGNDDVYGDLKAVFENQYFAPLVAPVLRNIPETYIYTASNDILRDDGILYAYRLRKDGFKVTHFNQEKAIHGIMNALDKYKESKIANNNVIKFLKEVM